MGKIGYHLFRVVDREKNECYVLLDKYSFDLAEKKAKEIYDIKPNVSEIHNLGFTLFDHIPEDDND